MTIDATGVTLNARPSPLDRPAADPFDGHGDPEMQVAIDATDRIEIHDTDGDADSLISIVQLPFGTGPAAMASGDLDGDGAPDLPVVLGGTSELMVLINTGGTLTIAGSAPLGDTPLAVALGECGRSATLHEPRMRPGRTGRRSHR
jgi:hypothetical protein